MKQTCLLKIIYLCAESTWARDNLDTSTVLDYSVAWGEVINYILFCAWSPWIHEQNGWSHSEEHLSVCIQGVLSAGSAVARGTKTNGSQWNRRVAGAADSGEEEPGAVRKRWLNLRQFPSPPPEFSEKGAHMGYMQNPWGFGGIFSEGIHKDILDSLLEEQKRI